MAVLHQRITADLSRTPARNLQHHYLPWPDPVTDHERTKPLMHPLVEQGPWPVAGPSAIVHTREQPLSPSGGNVLSAGQGVQRLRRLVNPYPTMGSGKDPRLEGRPKWRWTAVPRPSPTCCSAGGERSRPLKQHAEQRVQVNGYHRIAGDQHSVATPVQAEVSRRVPGVWMTAQSGSSGMPTCGSNACTTEVRSAPVAIFA